MDSMNSTCTNSISSNHKRIVSINDIIAVSKYIQSTILSNDIMTSDQTTKHFYGLDSSSIASLPLDNRPNTVFICTPMDWTTFSCMESNVQKGSFNTNQQRQRDEVKQENQRMIFNVEQQQQSFDKLLDHTRKEELKRLSQLIIHDLPTDDNIAQIIIEKLNFVMDITSVQDMDTDSSTQATSFASSSRVSIYSYPPINRTGQVNDHDRPFADYGHLGMYLMVFFLCSFFFLLMFKRSSFIWFILSATFSKNIIDVKTIARICQFNLETNPIITENPTYNRGPVRMNVKAFAITCWTHVSSKRLKRLLH